MDLNYNGIGIWVLQSRIMHERLLTLHKNFFYSLVGKSSLYGHLSSYLDNWQLNMTIVTLSWIWLLWHYDNFVKVADVGLSQEEDMITGTQMGTPNYMAAPPHHLLINSQFSIVPL